MLLKTGACFTNELKLAPNKTEIAKTFKDCNGSPVVPDTSLARCVDIPAPQALSIAGNILSLSGGGSVTLPSAPSQVAQTLSIAGNTVSLSGGGGSVTVPDSDAQALSISGNTLSLTNGGSVTLPAVPFATPAQTVAGTSTTLAVNPADLYARESLAAQTGLPNDVTVIPAPTANQSPWGVNLLGETLNYVPGLGWRIVANMVHEETYGGALSGAALHALATLKTYVAPRAGRLHVAVSIVGPAGAAAGSDLSTGVTVNGAYDWLQAGTVPVFTPGASVNENMATIIDVVAGDVIVFFAYSYNSYSIIGSATSLTYIN
jgi:hypothetical protein